MAILVDAGRIAIAQAVKDQSIYLAWGSGDVAWDTTPVPEPTDATALVAEIGRRVVTAAEFCTPNSGGDIIVPPGRFSVSSTPTRYLFLSFTFDFNDAPSAIIRELGVFLGTTLKSTVPPGTEYVVPSQIQLPGNMLQLERIGRLERSNAIRQRFEFVIQF